jgi:hypothetical protein
MNFPFYSNRKREEDESQKSSDSNSLHPSSFILHPCSSATLIPNQDDSVLIDSIASAVVRRGMETPAVLFLELNRPLAFLYSQGLHFATPLLGVFAAPEKVSRLAYLLDCPDKVEQLIARIEELAHEKTAVSGERRGAKPENSEL